jgi:recombination protein RecA
MNTEEAKTLKLAIDKLEKDFGKGTVVLVGDKPQQDVAVISTRSLGLDHALGIGGLPKGRIVEIYGPESSGKTTLCLEIIAEAQDKGGVCAIIDAEHALDFDYAEKLGIDVDELLLSQPDYGEQALEIARRLIETQTLAVVVIDSVAALTPKAEIEGEIGDASMGKQARLMSQSLRILTSAVSKSGTILIFTNQLREKIGVMFGSPETTTGGNALKFYASVRLDIRRQTQVKDGEIVVGNNVRVKVAKNKLASPFRSADFEIEFGIGINKTKEVLRIASDLEIVKKSGSWYSYNNDKLGQGESAVTDLLNDNVELFQEIKGQVQQKLKELREKKS